MNDPKTTPAFARTGCVTYAGAQEGMSRYAYVAMTFAAHQDPSGWDDAAMAQAFKKTDAFFAELAKRTK